ncbi:MAG TPA: hypothetical protein VKT70_03215, partial [Stellaceae bacterium]|nr:hypothetical protein [Stellaceae bacterium]
MRIVLAFSALLALAGNGFAQDEDQVFTGTVGQSPIVLRLIHTGDGITGSYFYRAQGVDIGLVAEGEAGQFIECPLAVGNSVPVRCDHPTGYWQLSLDQPTISGFWRKTSQATSALPITLTPVGFSDEVDDTYEELRAEGPTRPLDKKGASPDGAVAWQYMEEPRSGASIPQLTEAPVPTAMQAVNENLGYRFRGTVGLALAAKPGGSYGCDYTVPF